jgi:DNA-binding GntR family transcriptional regulator
MENVTMENITLNHTSNKKKISAADRAYSAIRLAIANGDLRPGFPLLETELSAQLGMSRTPVREALNRLKAEDMVETIRRKGIFVKTLSTEELSHMYEMAEGLEGMVAYLVASEADARLDELESNILTMEQALAENNTDNWIAADEDYHTALYNLCKNSYLVENLTRVHEKLRFARVILIAGSTADKLVSTRDHRATYEAIRAGDAERARTITQDHWRRVRDRFRGSVRQS